MFGRYIEKKNINLIKLREQYLEYCSNLTRNASTEELIEESATKFLPKFSDWYKKTNDDWEKVEESEKDEERRARFKVERTAQTEWRAANEDAEEAMEAVEAEKAKEGKIKEKADYINKKLELTEKELLAELLWKLSEDGKMKLKREEEMDGLDDVRWKIEQEEKDQQLEEMKKIRKIAKDEQDYRKYGS